MAESNGPRSSHCLLSSRFLFNEVTKILTITSPHKSDACPLQITPLFIISLSPFPPPISILSGIPVTLPVFISHLWVEMRGGGVHNLILGLQ